MPANTARRRCGAERDVRKRVQAKVGIDPIGPDRQVSEREDIKFTCRSRRGQEEQRQQVCSTQRNRDSAVRRNVTRKYLAVFFLQNHRFSGQRFLQWCGRRFWLSGEGGEESDKAGS